ncbi:ATP-binding cassette domain-containing protein [Micromonospora sp. BRA006-A]|nr:ATP-binding cassette domain-containing protein [Micromonospora sp. BRA006-A]
MLSARDIGLSYGSTVALAGASATVAEGSVVALVGPSGSGKSSMLYCMAGLLRPNAGEILFKDVRIDELSENARADLRRKEFGFVFQFAELVPELTLRQNIALPLELNNVARATVKGRVTELVELLGIADQADRRPAQVSGGQAQRAAVARAIAHRPSMLSPTSRRGPPIPSTGRSCSTPSSTWHERAAPPSFWSPTTNASPTEQTE